MTPLYFAFILSGLILFLVYRFKFSRRDELLSRIPSPRKLKFLHNAPQLFGLSGETLLQKAISWHQELGDVFHFTLHQFDDATIIVADTKIAEAISLHQPARNESSTYAFVSKWIGGNGFLLSKSGNHLKNRLKIIVYIFNPKHYDRYLKIANKHVKSGIEENMIASGKKVDAYGFFRTLALDIVFDLIMGFKLNSKFGSNKEYVDAIEEFAKIATKATLDPISRNRYLHPFTRLYWEEKKVLKVLRDFTRRIVQDRRRELATGSKKSDSEFYMINNYIETPIDGNYLTDEEIREELDTMILGSHDTTKSTTAFVLYHIGKYPEVQQKVFQEAISVLGDDLGRHMSQQDTTKLLYLDAVIKETLRLYAPVPFLGRKLSSEISVGGFTFPKNADIFISPFLAGRNPKYFDEPLTFKPERFLGLKTPPTGFIPFSVGARKCMGGNIAMMIMKVIIAELVASYKISLAKGQEDIKLSIDLILGPVDGIHVHFNKRQLDSKTF